MSDKHDGIKNVLHRYIAIGAVLLVLAMTVLDGTVVNVALPVLAKEFSVSDSSAVWIVTIYQLVITMLLLPVSSIGDIYSYRRNYIIGIIVFTVGSALCAGSISFIMLIGARAIQGIGAAMVMAVNVALVRLIYPPQYLGRGLAVNTMVISIASAAGPSLAGAILSVSSWNWLFLINIPVGIFAFIMAYKYLPPNPPREGRRPKFDILSAIANMIVFGTVFYALGNFARGGDLTANVLLLCCGTLVGIYYIRHQKGHEHPMLPLDLLHSRLYSLSIMTYTGSFIAQNIAMIALPFLFLNGYGFSEFTTGLLMTPWPLATMIVSPFAARFIERHNAGATAACGMMVYAVGIVLLLTVPSGNVSEWDIVWRMAICGAGFGIFQTPNATVMIAATPVSRSGAAGGFQSTARIGGQTLGATIVTLVFAWLSQPADAGSLHQGAPGVSTALVIALAFALVAGVFSLSRVKTIASSKSQ